MRPRDSELRAASAGHTQLSTHAAEDGGAEVTATGYLAVFDSYYTISNPFEGHFREAMMPGAFRKTVEDKALPDGGSKIRLQANHGRSGDNLVIGRFTDLREDAHGLRFEAALFAEMDVVRAMLPGIRAGQYGCSIMFRAVRDEFEDRPRPTADNPDAIPIRRIREAELSEGGIVTFPASPETSVSVRSLADEQAFARLCSLGPERIRQLEANYAGGPPRRQAPVSDVTATKREATLRELAS